jgi:hypothetical protein
MKKRICSRPSLGDENQPPEKFEEICPAATQPPLFGTLAVAQAFNSGEAHVLFTLGAI